VIPHRVVQKVPILTFNLSAKLKCDTACHHRMQSVGGHDTAFERVHIQVTHDYCATMSGTTLHAVDQPAETRCRERLIGWMLIQFTSEVDRNQGEVWADRRPHGTDGYAMVVIKWHNGISRESAQNPQLSSQVQR